MATERYQSLVVGNIQFPNMSVPDLSCPYRVLKSLAMAQATIESLIKDSTAGPAIHTCADCANQGHDLPTGECHSCRQNPYLHDNWRAAR